MIAETPGEAAGIPVKPRSARSGWVALGVLAVLQAVWVIPGASVGADFGQFWAIARIPLADRADPARMMEMERSILQAAHAPTAPAYLRPPVFALLFTPLKYLPLVSGYRVWVAIQFSALALLLWLLWREAGASSVFIGLTGFCLPVMYGIAIGQDAAGVALVAMLALLALRKGRDQLAGILFALCLYKFNLFVFVPVLLMIHRRWQALIWFGGAAAALALASMAIMPPGAYIRLLTHIHDYDPDFQPGVYGVGLRRLSLTAGPWLYWIFAPITLLGSFVISIRLTLEEGFALMIAATLTTAYYIYFYDYTLALIPIFFSLRYGARAPRLLAVMALAAPMLWLRGIIASLWAMLFVGTLMASSRAISPHRGAPITRQSA